MKKVTVLAVSILFLAAQCALADIDYHYISAEDFLQVLEKKRPVQIIDIQATMEYKRHHFAGTTPTNAYPVKTDQQRQRLAAMISTVRNSSDPVIIVGPRGTRAAQRTYAYLLEQGLPAHRLAILDKGILGWPALEFLMDTAGH